MSSVSHRGLGTIGESSSLADSSLVGFTLQATGAVERTLQSRLGDDVSIWDFASSSATEFRAALVAALAHLATMNGGRLHFPRKATSYAVNNTGLGPVSVPDSVEMYGDGIEASILEGTATDGTSLLQPQGGASRNGWVVRNMQLKCGTQAGHIVEPAADAGIGDGHWQQVYARNLNPTKSVWKGQQTPRGTFFYTWRDCRFENGTQGNPPSAPMFDIVGVDNSFGANKFDRCRFQCNGNTAPVFRMTNSSGGAYFPQVVFRDCGIELVRRGFLQVNGMIGMTIDGLSVFDSPTLDSHVIELTTGAGGLASEQCVIRNYNRSSGSLVAVSGTTVSVTSLTQAAGIATCDTAANHNLAVGQRLYMDGATPAGYNGLATVLTVPSATRFTYSVSSGLASPATGTITVGSAAQDVKLGADDTRITFDNVAGASIAGIEVDLNNNAVLILGDSTRVLYNRESESNTTAIRFGSESEVATSSLFTDTISAQTTGGQLAVNPLISALGGINLGGTSNVTGVQTFSATLDFGNVVAGGGTADLTVAATGYGPNHRVFGGPLSHPGAGLVWNIWMTTDTINVRLTNTKAVGDVNPASETWRFTVVKHN